MSATHARWIFAAALLSAACGDADGDAEPPRRSVASCDAGWRPLFGLSDGRLPTALAYAQGEVIFSSFEPGGEISNVRALAPKTGEIRSLVADLPFVFWVEDTTLLYARIYDARLFSVPLAGGESTVLVDAHRSASEVRVFSDGLDATHFYWLENEFTSFAALWRVPRQGGEASRLGVFEGLDFHTPVARSSDAMIAAGLIRLSDRSSDVPRVGARLIPLDGSAPRAFAEQARRGETILAIDRAGIYWNEPTGSYDAHWTGETRVTRTRVNGASREPFWPDKPGLVRPQALWSDGDGWIASAEEPFDDGARHQEIWRIEPNGAGHLLACDPGAGASPILVRPALANDAIYIVTSKTTETGEPAPRSTWMIVELPR